MVAKLSDSSNVGILVFLVMLGILVALMNKAGGSAAFGRWASTHIHTRAGAQFATLVLGMLIFVDDYQLPDRGLRDAPRDRPAEGLPRKAGLPH